MRAVRFTLTLFIILFLTTLFPQIDLAQADFLGNCTHAPDSQIHRPDGVVIRAEARNQRLVLVSLHTGDLVQELETSMDTGDLAWLDWSPDCRLLFGATGGDAIIWDAVNGGRLATFENVTVKNPPYWNPERENLILETQQGSFLWNFRRGEPMLLNYSGEHCPTRFRYFNWQVEWDNAGNQVLVVPTFVDGNVVIAYDQTTAQQVAAFDNACQRGPVKFAITPDNQNVIVFTSENEAFGGAGKAITVWNRDTMTAITVDAGNQSAVLPSQLALSADGSLLVLARVGVMRVWDMTHLPAEISNRDPIRRYPVVPNTLNTRFVDATTIELVDFAGIITRWDLQTGEPVG